MLEETRWVREIEKSMSTKELRMSDVTSDRMPDRFKAETSEPKSLGVEQMKTEQLIYSPKLDQPAYMFSIQVNQMDDSMGIGSCSDRDYSYHMFGY